MFVASPAMTRSAAIDSGLFADGTTVDCYLSIDLTDRRRRYSPAS